MLNDILPSYLYTQYNDDDDLQAFVGAQNDYARSYLNWFNTLNLPVYTSSTISGTLLDWVAAGLYGFPERPSLPSGHINATGGYNTLPYNKLEFNKFRYISTGAYYATNDDVFKRIITWSFYKGDGMQFSIDWLKRRVIRFLIGVNGTCPPIDNTYQVSVQFGTGGVVNILILNGQRTVTGGAIYNRFGFNTVAYNGLKSRFMNYTPLALAPVLQAGIASGALPLPFQFTYNVSII
jgi:hypothetical protein